MILRLLLLLTLVNTALASDLLPPDLEASRHKGIDSLFNMNYDGARDAFQQMIDADPNHPAGYIYMANTIWLGHLAELRRLQTNIYNRGNSFFNKTEDKVNPKIDQAFRRQID